MNKKLFYVLLILPLFAKSQEIPEFLSQKSLYVIFDRAGELMNAKALRPSDGESLYLQLEEVLKND